MGSDVLVNMQDQRRRPLIAATLREADGVVAVSQHLADHVVQLGADPGRVHMIPEGIDAALFSPGDQKQARAHLHLPSTGKILLFVGNLLFSKGAGVFIEACQRLRERRVPFCGYLVGLGRDESRLRSLIARHGLGDLVTLAGAYPHRELPAWYRACDLVVLPSFSEGIPNVLREASMCGKPFVATHVGGIPEISHPSFSRLVAPGAVDELAAAMTEMLEANPHVDEALVRQRNISWEQSAHLLAQRLQDAINSRSRSKVEENGDLQNVTRPPIRSPQGV
jgi:glycosyltransferase involved in cell wall biosynthesis